MTVDPCDSKDPAPVAWRQDFELARSARAGNPRAIDELLGRLACVRSFHMLRNAQLGAPLGKEELEDLVQETLIALWQKLELYNGSGSLEAWAYRFAYVRLLTKVRGLAYRPRLLDDVPGDVPEPQAPPGPDAFRFEGLYRMLDRVQPRDRDLVTMKVLEQATFEDLALHFEVPVGTVKTRFYRALGRLRRLLEAEEGLRDPVKGGRS